VPTNCPLTLEADLDQDACGELTPVLFGFAPASLPPLDAQVALLHVAAALVVFLGHAPRWTPALDLQRGTITLERGFGARDVAERLALLEAFARDHAAPAARAA
jgi:hypothetical protein